MARFVLVVLLCISWASLAFSSGDDDWDYDTDGDHGPKNWTGVCATGMKQSPIDIKSADETYDSDLGVFSLKNYDQKLNMNFTATNTGHSFKVSFTEKVYNVSGGGLKDIYTTVQFHLHWGLDNTKGSEHKMNGKSYAAELHFVSYNTKYINISAAVSESDGLAVLGVFIEVEGSNNTAFSFLDVASKLVAKDSEESIPAVKFDALLPADKTKYHRYNGSLTTPKCNEAVTWTVFNDAIQMSQYQMDLLRSLKQNGSKPLVNNFRPPQPLHDRKVKTSFQVPKPTTKGAAPVPTDRDSGASAVSMTAGLFLSMLFASLFLR